jgi:hypothetical protein
MAFASCTDRALSNLQENVTPKSDGRLPVNSRFVGVRWPPRRLDKSDIGGKGSSVHNVCLAGDTVGDLLKDISGPSLNVLIKLMIMVSFVWAPYL